MSRIPAHAIALISTALSTTACSASRSPNAVCANSSRVGAMTSEQSVTSMADYAIYSDHDRIGSIVTSQRSTDGGAKVEVSVRTRIDIDGFLFNYSFNATQLICIVDDRVEHYVAQVDADGERRALQATRIGENRLLISGSGSHARDSVNDTLVAEQDLKLFETAVDAVIDERTEVVTRQVLDLDDLKIKSIELRYAGDEVVIVGGITYDSHVVTFQGIESRGTQWLTPMRDGYLLVLERGEDEDGEYRIELLDIDLNEKPDR